MGSSAPFNPFPTPTPGLASPPIGKAAGAGVIPASTAPEIEQLDASAASITITGGTGGQAYFTHNVGATLLDYTDPTHPAILADGLYAFFVNLQGPAGGHAAIAEVDFQIQGVDVGGVVGGVSPIVTLDLDAIVPSDDNVAGVTIAITLYLEAGNSFNAYLDHSDADVAIAFQILRVWLQKCS